MTDTEVRRHVTKHLDRHNDYIAVYEVPVTPNSVRFSDGGEAIEDLLYRVPDTATPPPPPRPRVIERRRRCEQCPYWHDCRSLSRNPNP